MSTLQLLAGLGLALFLGVLALLLVAVALRFTDQPLPAPLTWATALVTGLAVGMTLVLPLDAFLVATVVIPGAALAGERLRAGRRVQAGLLVLAAALPWTVAAAGRTVGIAQGGAGDPSITVGSFLAGVGLVCAGLIVAALGDVRPRLVPRRPRRFGAITRAHARARSVGPVDGAFILAGTAALASVLVLRPDGPVAVLLPALVFGLVAGEAQLRQPPRLRRAMESFAYLGRLETEAFGRAYGRPTPTNVRAARGLLDAVPETLANRVFRPELLVFVGRFDVAREVVGRLPAGTPSERFDRAIQHDFVDWSAGGAGDLAAAEAAARDIPVGTDERLRAEAALAVARARRLAEAEEDWLVPLLAVRDRLAGRADGLAVGPSRAALYRVYGLLWLAFAAITLATGAAPGPSGPPAQLVVFARP